MSEPEMTEAPTRDETHDVSQDASLKQSPAPEIGEPPAGVLGVLRRHPIRAGIGLIAVVAAFVTATLWYLHARHYESTDDAFIDTGRFTSICRSRA
jgi:membrane fusion protein (multidrug efflux system)